MKKVAVFGGPGGGKSTLAKRLAELTQLPLYPLDLIEYRGGGGKVPHDEYLKTHAALRLSLVTHYRWVTKRLVKGLFVNPEGWPEHSPIWSSTMDCYRKIWLCNRHLTSRYRQLVGDAASAKQIHHLRSPAEMKAFLAALAQEHRRDDAGAPV